MSSSRHITIDCHVHLWPDTLAQRNLETIKTQSGISPVFNGTVGTLLRSMIESGVSYSLANNVVLKAELVSKANNWTASAISPHKELVGMGYVVAGAPDSALEVERCVKELHFKGIKIHHSHSKIDPADPKNYPIYEKLVELGIPVLFHSGKNPYTKSSDPQFSSPSGFRSVLASFPKLKAVLGHLAGFEDFPAEALDLLQSYQNAMADTAIKPTSKIDLAELIRRVGVEKIVFGSDYPIYDPASLLSWLRGAVSGSEFQSITSENPLSLFKLEL
ncbi:MAG: amidohydrolase family protein [Thaumarchaeota archaeon]|nr:amidohydrolase family protein [Nitrososphaerota archaeon]